MSPRSEKPAEKKIEDQNLSSQLWNRSFYSKTWLSYAAIGLSSALGLLFVIVADADSQSVNSLDSVQHQIQNSRAESMSSEIEVNENVLDEIQSASFSNSSSTDTANLENSKSDKFKITPIQHAVHERSTENLQPTRVELTSGGDSEGDSPVRLLGVIHILEEEQEGEAPAEFDLLALPAGEVPTDGPMISPLSTPAFE
ncbi:hypothetical protein Pla110_35810 [Polystyrenella longa]|uniref:Uncharacterized protein n=1 Tax=Polystyrenella longa TaxID=2528007 RepID=A0A518CRJ3_9PLAN|nr:hypothetical protein [Polystyrenella longa]QDU81830.1 hypothetical protein Pla110_35810 [Polystyrenella longa]